MSANNIQIVSMGNEDELYSFVSAKAVDNDSFKHISILHKSLGILSSYAEVADVPLMNSKSDEASFINQISKTRQKAYVVPLLGGSVESHIRTVEEINKVAAPIALMMSGHGTVFSFYANISGSIFQFFISSSDLAKVISEVCEFLVKEGIAWSSDMKETSNRGRQLISTVNENVVKTMTEIIDPRTKDMPGAFVERVMLHILSLVSGRREDFNTVGIKAHDTEANYVLTYGSQGLIKKIIESLMTKSIGFNAEDIYLLKPIREYYSHINSNTVTPMEVGYNINLASMSSKNRKYFKSMHVTSEEPKLAKAAFVPQDVYSQVEAPSDMISVHKLLLCTDGDGNGKIKPLLIQDKLYMLQAPTASLAQYMSMCEVAVNCLQL